MLSLIGNNNKFTNFSKFNFSALFSTLVKFKVEDDGKIKEIDAKVGDNLLEIAKKNNINLIGACEGSCACASCHVILDKNLFDKIAKPSEQEEDMLELAFGLTSTSRLACQLKIDNNFKNTVIHIPKVQRNISLDELNIKKI